MMRETSQCPHLICRCGHWSIVRPGCPGPVAWDPVNGDRKVWFTDCDHCRGISSRDILEEIRSERALRELL